MFLRDTLSSVSICGFTFCDESKLKELKNSKDTIIYSGNIIDDISLNTGTININTGCGQTEDGILSSMDVLSMTIIHK